MSAITARIVRAISNGAWSICRRIDNIFPEGNLPNPSWAPGRLLKARERKPMAAGVPRKTVSLCPDCNRQALTAVVEGQQDIATFRQLPGIIDAEILEEGGRILMRKACDKHGPFEDVLSNHPEFFRRIEHLAFGADFECTNDREIHNHGPNSIRTGRGTHLIVDLTNRCNMKCSPCYMDANAAPYVHELTMEDIEAIFANAASFKPQREINVLFSGGEATLSPIFLQTIRHAKRMGFHRLHVATNGIGFAEDPHFAFVAKAAGLHAVYLQFDGISEKKNAHRRLGNYMEVKQRALENIAAAGMRTTLQVTVMNNLNADGLGDIVRFAVRNIDAIHGIVFQPIMFSGRDESVSADERYARRYPISQIASDLEEQTCFGWKPMRDWFPASAYAAFAHLCDVLNPGAKLGCLFTDTHPDHAIFSALLVDREKAEAIPVPAFFNLEQFTNDIVKITDSARGPATTRALVALAALRNFDQRRAPSGFGLTHLRLLLQDCFYRVAGNGETWSQASNQNNGRWRLLFINTVQFQDLNIYDLAAVSNASTPVATQNGEIAFSAYNAAGWRTIVESEHRTASLAEWYKRNPRHEIYSNGRRVQLSETARTSKTQLFQIEVEPMLVTAEGATDRS
jgi:7,8-dihydro-6-hydroxymethylpterin dimethyltransferase